ncbi:MAG: HlyD family efflux transporter periplasmic adaptor subunit [bacterium]
MQQFIQDHLVRNLPVWGALALSAVSVVYTSREHQKMLSQPVVTENRPASESATPAPISVDLSKVPGRVEAIPANVVRIMPYNDWPLLQVSVHEGQRLKWSREKGSWVGDSPVVTTQFETPAEIDTFIFDSQKSAKELAGVRLKSEKAVVEVETELEQSLIRERNARQELDRQQGLKEKNATSVEALTKADNVWKLAVAEVEKSRKLLDITRRQVAIDEDVAKLQQNRAESELDLANFKRDMSWGKVPIHLLPGKADALKQVVVTKVNARIGDQPPRSGAPQVWVELVDDSTLMARAKIDQGQEKLLNAGQKIIASQNGESYSGELLAILPEVDAETGQITILVKLANPGLSLRMGSKVVLDLTDKHIAHK